MQTFARHLFKTILSTVYVAIFVATTLSFQQIKNVVDNIDLTAHELTTIRIELLIIDVNVNYTEIFH